ncbi:tetraacyldisaccharide 4'-kinase [Pontibacter sp. G13]|uniref:tetraacyldisaccharide 4'-kinase n=1 Tax=Pontibacter sp. G13 TaxID=3074898 RepID=UPI002889514B|nr:tetraacyldisaccharide 4'-kinase [Pontibacter sp. G13]WNJ16125.1 tetraacyldisaccharide 4'-kinase [Pontibacter sp. G13]
MQPNKWLSPLGWLYGAIMEIRNARYDRQSPPPYRAAIPVISVGNISAGGTGKTPFAEWLIDMLIQAGKRPAYLSRGYGRNTRGFFWVNGNSSVQEVGDEALQVATKFSQITVAVCESRTEGLKRLEEHGQIDLVILDDAFQHRKVARDLDLIMIDANRLPIHDRVIPAGYLRERIAGILRADAIVVNKVQNPSDVLNIQNQLSGFEKPMAFTRPSLSQLFPVSGASPIQISDLKTQPVGLFAGLGNNEAFFQQISAFDLSVEIKQGFADHHPYTESDIKALLSQSEINWITTEKDYQRLKSQPWFEKFSEHSIWYAPMKLEFLTGKQTIWELVSQLFS